MKTYGHKEQCTGHKVQEPGNVPCVLPIASAQRGFSLVTAIFLLVVIAALGTFAVTLSTTQQQAAAADVMGVRAYQAARAGIEWAAFGVSQTASGFQWAGCVPTTTFNAGTLGGTLAPFKVTVTCPAPASYVEGTATIWIYNVTSVATAGTVGSPGSVERDVTVKLGR